MVYCFIYKLLPLVQIPTQMCLFHILTYFNIIFSSTHMSASITSIQVFIFKLCTHFSTLPCTLHICLNTLTLIWSEMYNEQYKLQSSAFNFLHIYLTFTFVSKYLPQHCVLQQPKSMFFLEIRSEVPHKYKTVHEI